MEINNKKNKLMEFFRPTLGKISLTFLLIVTLIVLSLLCSPLYGYGGEITYPCGELLTNLTSSRGLLFISLILSYIISCLIIYLMRKQDDK